MNVLDDDDNGGGDDDDDDGSNASPTQCQDLRCAPAGDGRLNPRPNKSLLALEDRCDI